MEEKYRGIVEGIAIKHKQEKDQLQDEIEDYRSH